MTESGFDGITTLESTSDLVERVKLGEREALDRLFTRQLPALRRWARGRLPRQMRDLQDTEDLVQDTAIKAMRRLSSFVSRHPGALQAYLRQAVANRIRDEIRRSGRSPEIEELKDDARAHAASPLDEAIGVGRSHVMKPLSPSGPNSGIGDRPLEMESSYQEIAQFSANPHRFRAKSSPRALRLVRK